MGVQSTTSDPVIQKRFGRKTVEVSVNKSFERLKKYARGESMREIAFWQMATLEEVAVDLGLDVAKEISAWRNDNR